MENLLGFQEQLAAQYKYKKLNTKFSSEVRQKYFDNLPSDLCLMGAGDYLYSKNGTLIAKGYERVVIGDYGAFIEFSPAQAVTNAFKIKEGQEYRVYDPKYSSNVKYIWLTTKDRCDIKIYQQLKTVVYADYKAGMYYVSPYEVCVISS